VSEIGDTARVAVILADYAAVDAVQKVNILGAGWLVTGIEPQTGSTAPQALVLMVDVDPAHIGDSFTLEAALYDESQQLVQVPGPAGQPQSLRIGHVFTVERPLVPGHPAANWSHTQLVVNFAGGIPLAGNALYTWRVRIDGDEDHTWATSFYVAGTPQGPVIG